MSVGRWPTPILQRPSSILHAHATGGSVTTGSGVWRGQESLGWAMANVDLIAEASAYNEVDCRVMMEAVRYLRGRSVAPVPEGSLLVTGVAPAVRPALHLSR